jgi:hypothetical protein
MVLDIRLEEAGADGPLGAEFRDVAQGNVGGDGGAGGAAVSGVRGGGGFGCVRLRNRRNVFAIGDDPVPARVARQGQFGRRGE